VVEALRCGDIVESDVSHGEETLQLEDVAVGHVPDGHIARAVKVPELGIS